MTATLAAIFAQGAQALPSGAAAETGGETGAGGELLWLAAVVAVVLAAVHVAAGWVGLHRADPRSRWLSAASGVSVAYVFVHVLPDLAEGQARVAEATSGALGFAEHHVYVIALLGLVVFYGLERLAKQSRMRSAARGAGDETAGGVFWIHVGSFAVYNALIGYLLLHRETGGAAGLLLFGFAMLMHFLVNDAGMRLHYQDRYDRYGRWMLAAAVIAGLAVGAATIIHRAALAVLFAFLAGGIMLNVLKEELPEERKSNFWALAAGATAYAALLLAL